MSHATKPPWSERHAEPEPMRAMVESSPGKASFTAISCASAYVSAAYPAADDASPAAVGKLFADTTRTHICAQSAWATTHLPSASYRSPARARVSRSTVSMRLFAVRSSSTPLSQSRSRSNVVEAVTVVTVRRSRWLRVRETEELIGTFCLASRFPQYLITAMFVGEETVARTIVSDMVHVVARQGVRAKLA